MAEAQSLDGLRGRVLPAQQPQWLHCGCLVAVASSRYSEQASAKTMLLSEGIRGGLIHYLLWNKPLLKMTEWTGETEWMKSLPRRLRVQQFNPWPRKREERRQREWEKGGTRRGRRYIPSSPEHGWRRGAAGGFHSLSSHQRSCCSPYGIWPFLTNRPPIHSQHTFSSSWNKVKKVHFFMPSEHWMAMRALHLCLIHIV